MFSGWLQAKPCSRQPWKPLGLSSQDEGEGRAAAAQAARLPGLPWLLGRSGRSLRAECGGGGRLGPRAQPPAHASPRRGLCFDALWAGPRRVSRPHAAIGERCCTSQGSKSPPGSPLSREEAEAPTPAPAPEGRRRSRRVRLRGSCRHRPSVQGRRELSSSTSAGAAPASPKVSPVGNNGARGEPAGRGAGGRRTCGSLPWARGGGVPRDRVLRKVQPSVNGDSAPTGVCDLGRVP